MLLVTTENNHRSCYPPICAFVYMIEIIVVNAVCSA